MKLNDLYHSEKGIEFSREELLPLLARYAPPSPHVLEVGSGRGRNLLALTEIPGSRIVGCDIDANEVKAAQQRLTDQQRQRIELVVQQDPDKLPFPDNSFDVVVMWQLLEHVFSPKLKDALVIDASRILKHNGILIIETPNLLFPIDYHDTNIPLIHWGPKWIRRFFLRRLWTEQFPPSEYTHIYRLRRALKGSPHLNHFTQLTRIYFEERYRDIFQHMGGTRTRSKWIFFTLYAPVYMILRLLHIPGDLLTPSVRVVFRMEK